MAKLTFTGRSGDGKRLLLVEESGQQHSLAIDARLRRALAGAPDSTGQLEIPMESTLRPRDIQARIRAGETPEAVAHAAGTSVEKIMAFAAPVMAERAHVAQQAQLASVRRRSDRVGCPHPRRGRRRAPALAQRRPQRRRVGRVASRGRSLDPDGAVRRRGPRRHRDLLPRPARQLRDRRRRRRPLAGRRRLAGHDRLGRLGRARRRRPRGRPPATPHRGRRRRYLSATTRSRWSPTSPSSPRASRPPRPPWRSPGQRSAPSSPSRPTSRATRRALRRGRGRRPRRRGRRGPRRRDRRRDRARAPAAGQEARPRLGAELGRDHVRRRQERLTRVRLLQLNVHPLKSGAIRPVDSADGAARAGWPTTARGCSSTATGGWSRPARCTRPSRSSPTPRPPTRPSRADLRLRAPGLRRPRPSRSPTASPIAVRLFSLDLRAIHAPAADAWLSRAVGRERRTPGVVPRPAAAPPPAGLLPTGRPHRVRGRVPGDGRLAGLAAASSTTGSSSAPSSSARSRRSRCRSSGSAPTSSSTATSRSPRTTGRHSTSAGCGSGWPSPPAAA